MNDIELVSAARRGDRQAFGVLVDRYWRTVVALAVARLGNTVDAEDAAQETFLSAYARLEQLRHDSRFAGWLLSIARRKCRDAHRMRKRVSDLAQRASDSLVSAALHAPSPNPGLTAEQADIVRGAVAGLSDKYQNVVLLRFMAGLSTVRIAEVLGKRPGTVRVQLHRAYAMLERKLRAFAPEVT